MITAWVVLSALVYATGFTVTARATHRFDCKHHVLGQDDPLILAIFWPLTLIVFVVVVPFAILYKLAVYDYGQPDSTTTSEGE